MERRSAQAGGDKTADWFSDDEFWIAAFPFMFPEEDFTKARDQVEKIISLSGVGAGAVLDLACGPGRHSVPLAERGFDVTGVDRTPFLLDRARAYAERQGAHVDWVEADMRSFCRLNTYDLAVSIFTSLGYFDTAADNQRALDNVADSLKPGGTFVVDVRGKEIVARNFSGTSSTEIENAGVVVQRHRLLDGWSRIETEWMLVRDSAVQRFALRTWLYSGAELRAMLERAGFTSVELFGSLDGIPYDQDARRLVAVARKPA
jgi:SAM-dependent methyltransferase